jgi:hypothetical protein
MSWYLPKSSMYFLLFIDLICRSIFNAVNLEGQGIKICTFQSVVLEVNFEKPMLCIESLFEKSSVWPT